MSSVPLGRPGDGGTWLPPFVDAHVHLGLVDPVAVRRGGIAVVHDLGWVPDVARTWPGTSGFPEVAFAGAFLTAPGGYPSDRSWAPPGSIAEVGSPDEAVAAVDRQVAAGASFVKVALHSEAGPVPDDVTLAALVGHAHARGRDVVAHVEGRGMAARAFEAGVDRFAHAPFSERLPDALIRAMARPRARSQVSSGSLRSADHDTARRRPRHEGRNEPDNDPHVVLGGVGIGGVGVSWVSTLDIHGWGRPTAAQDVAIDNVRRFAALGGTVVYGTDLGNGPLPLGVNVRELRALAAAGLDANALLAALTSGNAALAGRLTGSMTFVPGSPPDDLEHLDLLDGPVELDEFVHWLAGATTLYVSDGIQRDDVLPSDSTSTSEDSDD